MKDIKEKIITVLGFSMFGLAIFNLIWFLGR